MESNFHSWQEFIAMGGYGLYVWGAYGALILCLILGAWTPWRQRKALLNSLQADESVDTAVPENH